MLRAIESVTKWTVSMIPTMIISSPTAKYQPTLKDEHGNKPKHKRFPKPTHPLLALPNKLKMNIFDRLDPIDSTSLGLTSHYLYPTYRHRFLKPLLLDHLGEGQLALEWKDRVPERDPNPRKPFCWKCGPCRCELQRHIQDFVGRDALKKQIRRRLRKMGRSTRCDLGKCAMDDMGFDPSTRRPCGCWH
ncbi:uncharacterized protein B0J16DRAFT_317808 [Fusarium flagelliforme]|uniref:uncharacterized protein n=1 Tax=Fusarium flagelliforme TaxID=2675880 RepID=UPI001E8D0465|nr:uncharacterized protein B0J16DRAFT_317808 [Fusarium flagelliforme]KAH7188138.1 hypothetical protein B0J16DRAFT_317808 [Fusarium flagelliforme]